MKNNQYRYLLLAVLMVSVFFACGPFEVQEGISSAAKLKELFADPPSKYLSAPLWVWHEDIQEIKFIMK